MLSRKRDPIHSTGNRKPQEVKKPLRILEYGFGTGLNALLTYKHAEVEITYTGLEAYPINPDEAKKLDYGKKVDLPEVYQKMHQTKYGETVRLSPAFQLQKIQSTFQDYRSTEGVDLIYYDAFGPRVQRELWTTEQFITCSDNLNDGGILVTYCAQGQARRNLQAAGFTVERLPGPPGKREMLRGRKL